MEKLIGELTGAVGLPGYESGAGAIFRREMEEIGLETESDELGNVYAYMGQGERTIMVTAHMDEVGLMVTSIDRDGALRVRRMGGVDPRILPGSRVRILARGSEYMGVACACTSSVDEGKSPAWSDIFIDTGMSADKVRRRIPIGTPVALTGKMTKLSGEMRAAKTADDRIFVAMMCEAARRLRDIKLCGRIGFVAATQEEVGSRGAAVAAWRMNPDIAIAMDVTFAHAPGCDSALTYPADKVVMSMGPNIHRALHKRAMELAGQNGIDVNVCVSPGTTGTDAEATQVAHLGIPSVLIEVPLKYMHTTVETFSMGALNDACRLLCALLRDIMREWGECDGR